MIKGIYHSARTLEVKMKNIDSVANNLANITTSGYKRQIPFLEVLNESGGINIKQYTDFKQGELVATNNPLDLGLKGEGYFALKGENGIEYTRNGKFTISEEGFLVNDQGFRVLGQGGEINVFEFMTQDNQDITVSSSGELKIGKNVVDTIKVVRIDDPQNTLRLSGLNFTADDGNVSVLEEESYEIHQGYTEESNVNPVIEMESMIRMNTDYESAHKMMKYLDESLAKANDIGRIP